jgi:hypothetical protein
MPRSFRWLLALTLLVAAAWYVITPRRAYDDFRVALLTGSESGLQATVDFPAVRDNLKRDLAPALDRAGGRLGATVGGVLMEQAVNSVLTPTGLSQLVTGFGSIRRSAVDVSDTPGDVVTTYRYKSPSRVEVEIRPAGDPDATAGVLTFTRSALSWRLTRISSDRLMTDGNRP